MKHYAFKHVISLLTATVIAAIAWGQQEVTAGRMQPDSLPAAGRPDAAKKAMVVSGQLANDARTSVRQVIAPGKQVMDSLLRSAKSGIGTLLPVNLFKKGNFFKVNAITVESEYTYLHDTSGMATGFLKSMQSMLGYEGSLSISLASMPFEARLAGNNAIYSFYNTPYRNFPQFNFNHEKYLEQLQRQVLNKVNPEAVLSSALSRINTIKTQYESALHSEIKKISQEFESTYAAKLDVPSGVTDLSVNDLSSLRGKMLPQELVDAYRRSTELYSNLNNGSYDGLQKDSLQGLAIRDIKKYEAMEKIYGRITGWKEKFDGNPLVKELRSHLPFTPGKFKSFLKKPGNLVDVIKSQASLSGLQRLFLNVTQLDIGTNPISGGELNMQGLMNSGVNAEFTGKRSSVGIIYGAGNANVNNWMQAGLTSIASNEYSRLMGVRFGSGWNSGVKQSLSLNFFDFNPSQDLSHMDPAMLQSGYLSNAGRRDAVITYQTSVSLGADHRISADLSRSFGAYRNSLSGDSTVSKNNAFSDAFGNNGKSNYAAAIAYEGTVLKTGIDVSFKKAGLGYSNPGNIFIRRGETRIGLGLDRKLFKQKLTVRYKTDLRSQHFDPSKRYTYTNFSNDVRISYRLKRNTRFGAGLRHNNYHFDNKGQATVLGGSSMSIQGDGQYQFAIGGRKMISNFILTRQRFDMPMLSGVQYISKNWLLSHSSSMVLERNLLTVSVLLNQSDNSDYYFNTSFFNTEISYGYAIGEKIRLNTGTGFYSNTGWNKQVGFRQQVSGTVWKRFEIDIDMTWKKAVQTTRAELANQVYISSSVHYRF